jgi:hypothetical protein
MAPISKLDMLDCSTIGFRVCLFSQSPLLHLQNPQHWLRGVTINFANLYALFTPFLYVLWQGVPLSFNLLLAFMMLEGGITLIKKSYNKCHYKNVVPTF